MKTLVIHPKDATTDFLSVIYKDKDWDVIRENVSKKELKSRIKSSDRIIMLGHGTESGLLSWSRVIINSDLVYLLREKFCVGIWCNANLFFKKYDLKGYYTGMIVSEMDEALYYLNYPVTDADIENSNKLFAIMMRDWIDEKLSLDNVVLNYFDDKNEVILYNRQNIFENLIKD